ncbi:hypothetical protein XcvCFBP7111P_25270 (plasmid) [Xanthomonas citri pv. vignicola]|uniref:Avirulence protein n=1 Tax=Xanthomonas citri pv. vignicola TaxID=473426 RepID=A0AB33CPS2_XANCI|nr:hypothetical protein XcvCFBP7111P_25270 [Xanthomonas citri pv. vignicola]
MARRGLVPTHEATLQIPCNSGGAHFTARAVVCGERQLGEVVEAAARAAPLSVASSRQCSLGEGADYAEFLATMSEHMDLAGAAKLLQDLYEQGAVSYPRPPPVTTAPEDSRGAKRWHAAMARVFSKATMKLSCERARTKRYTSWTRWRRGK